MSNFSSFYAGKKGADIVIKYHFDGIDIPQPDTDPSLKEWKYTADEYAVGYNGKILLATKDDGGNVLVNAATQTYVIKKTVDNYHLYNFKVFENNGKYIDGTDCKMPEGHQIGMTQFFRKGTETTGIVDYGEYVIIDTIVNAHSNSNPDNGKVFRRGLDLDNEYGGGEYIGQIVGPKGDVPQVDFESYGEVTALNPDGSYKYPARVDKSLSMENGGMIEGSGIGPDGQRYFNDEIKYSYTNVYDEFKNLIGTMVGFQFPQLQIDFHGESQNPYDGRVINEDGSFYYTGLFTPDAEFYDEPSEKWDHPMYQRWLVKIPYGIHGADVSDIEVVPTQLKIQNKYPNFQGATVYQDENCEIPLTDDFGFPVVLRNGYTVAGADMYDSSPTVVSAKIFYDGQYRYVKKTDCCEWIFRYKETSYEDRIPQSTYVSIGEYKSVEKVDVSPEGIMTIYYNNNRPEDIPNKIRWIDSIENNGVQLDKDGTLRFNFNTLDANGNKEFVEFEKVFDRIIGIEMTNTGELVITFNTDKVQIGTDSEGNPIYSNEFRTKLRWINKVNLTEDGTLEFFMNDDPNNPISTFEGAMKSIKDVQINTTDSSEVVGSGNQKVHVVYNTGDEQDVGEPLNYIIEATVSNVDKSVIVAPNHLLIYFSDPEIRKIYQDKWVVYPSSSIIDGYDDNGDPIYHEFSEWVDFGNMKGETGCLLTYKNITNLDELTGEDGKQIPPEVLAGNDAKQGWGITYTDPDNNCWFMMYDYETGQWYDAGRIDYTVVSPESMIVLDRPVINMINGNITIRDARKQELLKENGIFLAKTPSTFAL